MNNVFKLCGYSKRYYITHPWVWIKDIWTNHKMAIQRARHGWCVRDAWNMNDWMCDVFSEMLMYLKKYHCGYPHGMTDEEWENTLEEMANLFATLGKRMRKGPDVGPDMDTTAVRQKFIEYNIENDRIKNKLFDFLKDNFYSLWD